MGSGRRIPIDSATKPLTLVILYVRIYNHASPEYLDGWATRR
jgi:hypothetical protein